MVSAEAFCDRWPDTSANVAAGHERFVIGVVAHAFLGNTV
jgi:hypothetical protein